MQPIKEMTDHKIVVTEGAADSHSEVILGASPPGVTTHSTIM